MNLEQLKNEITKIKAENPVRVIAPKLRLFINDIHEFEREINSLNQPIQFERNFEDIIPESENKLIGPHGYTYKTYALLMKKDESDFLKFFIKNRQINREKSLVLCDETILEEASSFMEKIMEDILVSCKGNKNEH